MESGLYNNFHRLIECIYNQCSDGIHCICSCFFKNKYKCEICETRYNSKHDLASHIRKSHSEIYAWGSSKKFREILETEKLI
jgi:hypothetical protein